MLTLAEALRTAETHQPSLRMAEADARAAQARADITRADWLPQVTGTASYQRMTGNFVGRPGAIPRNVATTMGMTAPATRSTKADFDFYRFYSFGLNATQLVYDFGRTGKQLQADKEDARAATHDRAAMERSVAAQVRLAFFMAQAQRALIHVSRAALENQERHLAQVQAFVEVGTRPEIDLAQQRADTANARVAVLQSENAYQLARVSLNQAMGVEQNLDYDVEGDVLAAVQGEEAAGDVLWTSVLATRAELLAAERRVHARELAYQSARAGHAPSLGLTGSATIAGVDLRGDEGWNIAGGVVLTVPIAAGGRTTAQVHEAEALLQRERAARDQLRQAVRVELEQARLTVVSQKAVLTATLEAVEAARTRLSLAEGRYEAGVGSILELGDAQLALSQAEAQRVQAEYDLSAARAELLRALGQDG